MADATKAGNVETYTNSIAESESTYEGMTKFDMHYTTSRLNLRMHEGSSASPAKYYLQSKSTLTTPHYLLRNGDSKSSPAIAFVQFNWLSRHMQIGRGDFAKEAKNEHVKTSLQREKNLMRTSDYSFTTAEGSDTGKEVEYHWHKEDKWGKTVYGCVDGHGRLIARLLSGGALNWDKAGELELSDGLDMALKELLIVGAVGIWTMEGLNYRSPFQGYDSKHKK